MKKILFPTDFSKNALHASQYAGMLARVLEAEIILLHIYSNPVFSEVQLPYAVQNFEMRVRENAEQFLKNFTQEFLEKTGIEEKKIIQKAEYGIVHADGIVAAAQAHKVDFIVMGTQGTSDILDRWFGTTAQRVMKTAECPVWVIPQDAPLTYPANILYAADYKEDEILATQKVLAIAKPLGASCKVLHIHDYYEPSLVAEVKEMGENLKDKFMGEDISFRNLNRTDVVAALETYIETAKPDVLALAVHEKSVLSKIFDTSVTRHFVQKGKLPLLTFRKE